MMVSKAEFQGRLDLYRLLSRLYRTEADEALLENLKALVLPEENEDLKQGAADLRNYLATRGPGAAEELAVDYAAVFLAAGSAEGAAALPCESVYTGPKRIFMQEAWEQVSRLYAEKGLGKDDASSDLMEDHIALELAFMAWLIDNGTLQEQKAFLENHLLNWLPAFAADVEQYGRTPFYKAVTKIALGFLRLEQELLAALCGGALSMAISFSVRNDRFAPILLRLKERYRVFAPRRFPKRGPKGSDLIRYGEIDALTDIVYREKSHLSAKEVFYPVSQTLFTFTEDECTQKEPEDDRDIILLARPCDLNAIRRLDRIFLRNGRPDLYYARMREKLHLFLLECRESFKNCFCVSMGSNVALDHAAAVRIDDICALIEIRDETFLPYFQDEVPIDFTPEFVQENTRVAHIPEIRRESLEDIIALDYWKQFDGKCIGCGGCNTACPTCSCFDTVDVIYHETSRDGERRRVWSSCMLEDFTRTAGGELARKTPGENMRFKVLHKIFDYKLRFGDEHMCVGCGRCVDRCPKEIDYLDVVNGLSDLLAAGKEG